MPPMYFYIKFASFSLEKPINFTLYLTSTLWVHQCEKHNLRWATPTAQTLHYNS